MNLAYSKNFQKLNLLSTKTRKKHKIITTAPRARRESDAMQGPFEMTQGPVIERDIILVIIRGN